MVTLRARPKPLDIELDRTALVIVDMQNGFASKGGLFDLAGFDISRAPRAVEVNRRLLEASRRAGLKVVHLQMTFKPDLSDAGGPDSPNYHKELALLTMRARPELAGTLLVENTWDWRIVEPLAPAPGEHVVKKSRYSGFCRTDLAAHLRGANIRNLLFTGIATNVCVESTARDAFFEEFWPILIEDAMSHSGPDFNRQATLWNFEHVFGWVTDADAVEGALAGVGAKERAAG
jgi:ureidoacrylate peracid hydrolase